MWEFNGQRRPPFADPPGPGQESVWDYPRPPVIDGSTRRVDVRDGNRVIASSAAACRVLETASPPTWYLPPGAIDFTLLTPVSGGSWCEWKGQASYFGLSRRRDGTPVAWTYREPTPAFRDIAGWLSFYPARVGCYVDDERVRAQPGGFYGGWLTDDIAGPCKGPPGTGHW